MGNRYNLGDDCTLVPHLDTPGVCNTCGTRLTGRKTQWCSDECQNVLRRNHDWGTARHAAVLRDGHKCVQCGGTGERRQWIPLNLWDPRHRAQIIAIGLNPDSIPGAHRLQIVRVLPWLEVNHIDPRVGRGYGWGCHNHLSNLETLCHVHHVEETKRQAAERRALAAPPSLLDLI